MVRPHSPCSPTEAETTDDQSSAGSCWQCHSRASSSCSVSGDRGWGSGVGWWSRMLPPSQGCAFPLQPASTPSGLLGWIPSLPDPNWTNCYFRPILFLPKPGIILPLISRPCSAGFPAQAFWLAAFKQLPRFSDSPSPALEMAVDTSSSKAPGPGSGLPRHPSAPGPGVSMAPCSVAAADIPTPQPEECKVPARTLQAGALPAPHSPSPHRVCIGPALLGLLGLEPFQPLSCGSCMLSRAQHEWGHC